MKILSAIAAIFLFIASGASKQTTNTLSDAEIQGQQFAQKILEQRPTENSTQTGILKIRFADGTSTNLTLKVEVVISETNWQTTYTASFVNYDTTNNFGWEGQIVSVVHTENHSNEYKKTFGFTFGDKFHGQTADVGPNGLESQILSSNDTMIPFANSDFWIADLGLEFFHWPAQKVLKKEVHRSRGCTVLESTNPNPGTNGYSRVVSWIDNESLGIVEAYAYDVNGKKLKDFYPKDFKKVDGQWQVQTLVMENVQTGSRSRLEFDLKKQ